MQDYIYDENGEIIETNFELYWQYDEETWNDYGKDNTIPEYDYDDLA